MRVGKGGRNKTTGRVYLFARLRVDPGRNFCYSVISDRNIDRSASIGQARLSYDYVEHPNSQYWPHGVQYCEELPFFFCWANARQI
jgi:hypothetical protein